MSFTRSRRRFAYCSLVLTFALSTSALAGPVVLETPQLRFEIADDGAVRSLTSKPQGVEYASAAGAPCPVGVVYRGGVVKPVDQGPYAETGQWTYEGGSRFPVTAVSLEGDRLTLTFQGAEAKATYRVRRTDGYLAFELLAIEGKPVDRIEFPRACLRKLPMLGQWIHVAWDEYFSVCLCGGNLQTDADMVVNEDRVLMTTAASSDVGFAGAVAVLFGCHDPKDRFLDAMARIERDFDLPPGAARRKLPNQKLSYFFAGKATPSDIDQYIAVAKQGGFRILLISYGAFARSPGHFQWNDRYPNGMDDLRRVADRVRSAGLKLGLHIHYNKVRRIDPYITPVPDDRLHYLRRFTLASPLTPETTTIVVREDPAGLTLEKDRRVLKLGKEFIQYDDYTQSPPYQLTGCQRGLLGTMPASHDEGTQLGLLHFDASPSFVLLDQTSDIQDEVAHRIAEIYRQTGPYEMFYFDGAEDVHEPFHHHAARAQYRVYRLLEPAPPVCESALCTPMNWHLMTRGNAYDKVATPDRMKDFCRLMPCPSAAALQMDFSRIDFGWLNIGRSASGYPGPDVVEYIASRAAGWDCPLSVSTSPKGLQSNPRIDDCLAVLKIWEDARLGNHLTDADCRRLRIVPPENAHYVSCYRQRGIYQTYCDNGDLADWQRRILADRREHHLFINRHGRYELVDIEEIPDVAHGKLKACLFQRQGEPNNTYVLAWAVEDPLQLRLGDRRITAMRPFGHELPCPTGADSCQFLIGPRTYLCLRDVDRAGARRILQSAVVVH